MKKIIPPSIAIIICAFAVIVFAAGSDESGQSNAATSTRPSMRSTTQPATQPETRPAGAVAAVPGRMNLTLKDREVIAAVHRYSREVAAAERVYQESIAISADSLAETLFHAQQRAEAAGRVEEAEMFRRFLSRVELARRERTRMKFDADGEPARPVSPPRGPQY